jgi:uncharacterized protein with PIN domain
MVNHFDINTKPKLIYCPNCNGKIIELEDKKEVKGEVAHYTYKTHDKFFRCQKCGQIYWFGSHMKLAKKYIESLDED